MSILLQPFYDVYYSRLTNLIHFWRSRLFSRKMAEISGKDEKKFSSILEHFILTYVEFVPENVNLSLLENLSRFGYDSGNGLNKNLSRFYYYSRF